MNLQRFRVAEAPVDPVARFAFGRNWRAFLDGLNDTRIARAEESLREMLGVTSLQGLSFLDIGSGSGLFSLAARRLGATVRSFDYDPDSVACTEELRRRYFPGDPSWTISRGSVLDAAFLDTLGTFDIVYSWGVLHHTGHMWTAVDHAAARVRPGGRFFIALYNDQGRASVWWRGVKRTYVALPRPLQYPYALAFGAALEAGAVATALLRRNPRRIIERWRRYDSVRGMSRWHDIVDWVGGYPFEVATPAEVVAFCEARGLTPHLVKTCGRKLGCNEFVFRKDDAPGSSPTP